MHKARLSIRLELLCSPSGCRGPVDAIASAVANVPDPAIGVLEIRLSDVLEAPSRITRGLPMTSSTSISTSIRRHPSS